mmetsp:Transcript_33482/g.99432  ORF Transcript_33482/g.99432 Transcript_33482/m.99432 type:complete len:121 (+) Transcript_33482:63-425(+)
MAKNGVLLPLAVLLVGAWVLAPAFVGSQPVVRSTGVAMNGAKIALPIREGKEGLVKEVTGAFEYSTGARNEVSLITPAVDSEGIKGYLSLNITFFGIMMIMTAGGMVELQRFFPDAGGIW